MRSRTVVLSLCAMGLLCVLGIWASVAQALAVASGQGSDKQQLDAFWARAKEEIYRSPEELAAQHAREVRKGIIYNKLIRGNPHTKTVALTFDDGPHPQYTPQLLSILKREGVKATFFVVGEMAEQYRDLVRAEHEGGHLVGNHTFHHVNLTKIPSDQVRVEWQACQDVVKSITGEAPRFCRPPGGDYDVVVMRAAEAQGLTTVLWTDDPGDYASPGDLKIETRVLDHIGNGGIILIHDGVQQTVDVLPQIVEHLKRRGFRFVTVAEMEVQTGRK